MMATQVINDIPHKDPIHNKKKDDISHKVGGAYKKYKKTDTNFSSVEIRYYFVFLIADQPKYYLIAPTE